MPLVRRRPLLRAAMVGGAGYTAGRRRARKEETEPVDSPQGAQSRQPPAHDTRGSMSEMDRIDALKTLGELHDSGVLTDDQFEAERERLI